MKIRATVLVLLFSAIIVSAQAVSEVEITAEPSHHLVFENQYVRVFKVEVAPHAATLMHRHRHDYVYVTLGASSVENDVEGKSPVTIKRQDGETHFLACGYAHVAKNLSDQPFRSLIIEFLQDEAARKTPPPRWDEERAMHVLEGGTQDVMFVQDGVRATDLQLQPGGVLPKHHHAGPHLAVAITDLDLRSDVEGKGPARIQLKAGEVKWVEGGFTHTVSNISKQNARLITLEFQ
jgi:quercetin dioxygenase-like cupin family protein